MIERLLGSADGSGCNRNATGVERGHRYLEPFALTADEVASWDLTILEKHLTRRMRKTHRSLAFADRKAGCSLLDYERADAFCAFSLFGYRHHDVNIGFAAVSYPNLLSAKYIFIPAQLRSS